MSSLLVILSLTITGASTSAADRAERRASRVGTIVSLSGGTGFSFGRLNTEDGTFARTYQVMFPLSVTFGQRVTEEWVFSAYVQHGFTPIGCSGCSGFDSGVGLESEWHAVPRRDQDPYIGFRLGWELANLVRPGLEEWYQGPEVSLRFGFDWVANRSLRYGFYVGGSASTFLLVHTVTGTSEAVPQQVHGWVFVGLRLAFGPLGAARVDSPR